jgi:hypothetical protein
MSAKNRLKRAKFSLPDPEPAGRAIWPLCRSCRQPFSDANVYSEAGWLEVRISGLCEVCFDTLANVPDEADGFDCQGMNREG